MNAATLALRVAPRRLAGERALMAACVLLPLLGLALFFGYPLLLIAVRSVTDVSDHATLANYARLGSEPGLLRAAWHSVLMAGGTTVVSVAGGLAIAIALQRSRLRLRWLIRAVLLLPMLAPSLMQGLGLLFLLGRNGLVHRWTGLPTDIYGFWGLLIANTTYALPQAALILGAALARTDRRLYDAAETMGASAWRQFVDVTLPQARYGLLAAAFVVFSVAITDFGNAIVVGGPYRVLATEIYDQVAGQMDLNMGAAVGMVLLLPAVLSLLIERAANRRQGSGSEHAQAGDVGANRRRDLGLAAACIALLAPVLAIFLTVIYASVIKLWPYNLSLTLAHYRTDLSDGYTPIVTSLKASVTAATLGTILLFLLAFGARRLPPGLARMAHLAASLPAAVPGLVVGIAYVLAFNTGPLSNWLYGSLTLVVLCNFYHYHAQGYLTMATGLRAVPGALEDAVACLGGGPLRAVRDVVLPFAAPALVSVFFFLFMQSMVTLSAVVFLVTPDLSLAAVSVMQLDENGFVSQAAAYTTCIVLTVAAALGAMRLCAGLLTHSLQRRRTPHVA